jgi:hypothetical protein
MRVSDSGFALGHVSVPEVHARETDEAPRVPAGTPAESIDKIRPRAPALEETPPVKPGRRVSHRFGEGVIVDATSRGACR